MFRLILLTLVGLGAVMMFLGDGAARRTTPPAPAAATPEAQSPADEAAAPDSAQGDQVEVTGILPASEPAAAQPAAAQKRFPGPALRPSPEYAGEAPAENLAEAPTDTLYVTADSVNFRAGPTTSDAVIGRLTRGEIVTAIGARSGDWIEIRDEQGSSGFIAARFLSAERP